MDPYRVWLSEIMLQQTTTATVAPYFQAFTERWPRLADLATASLDEVLHAWQGLGYYARARNLYKCARLVWAQHGGRFPESETALRALPGVGPYTAAAIAAIAFGQRATVVDGNVERVVARLFDVGAPLPTSKKRLHELAATLTPRKGAGDYAQAMMDLGATVCLARNPMCDTCPWAAACAGRAAGHAAEFPRRLAQPARPTRYGLAFWTVRRDGAILLRRRPESGLLGGLMEVPTTSWRDQAWDLESAPRHAPCVANWQQLPGTVRHSFTHFHLRIVVFTGDVGHGTPDGVWCPPGRLSAHALPTVMIKVVRHVMHHPETPSDPGPDRGGPQRAESCGGAGA